MCERVCCDELCDEKCDSRQQPVVFLIRHLCRGVAQDVFAVGVESHAPKTHASHELLGALELAIASEDGVDKLAATVLAHGDILGVATLFLGGLPHVVLANLEELVEALPQALARLEEVVDHVAG